MKSRWIAAVPAGAPPPQAPVTLAFSTLGQGTAWHLYGATIADLLRKALPPGSNVTTSSRWVPLVHFEPRAWASR